MVGASSLGYDPAKERFERWAYIPYVTDSKFDSALIEVVKDHDIGEIYTPNVVVWNYLHQRMASILPEVRLINGSPISTEVLPYRNALKLAGDVAKESLSLAAIGDIKPRMSELECAALFRHADSIPGMCDNEKIRAIFEIFRYAPEGDVVEIGSWWGKSAFVLLRLSQYYDIGNVLCVDPWSNVHMVQNDEKGLVDQVPFDAEEALGVFHLNMLPYSQGRLNYLRLPSLEAADLYKSKSSVASIYGETSYRGKVAVLHVDGNHKYENAVADVMTWLKFLLPGGWIIVDDYIWPYGDGPMRAGNELVEVLGASCACAFVMGSALFVQLAR